MANLSLHPYWFEPKFEFVGPDADVERTSLEIGADAWIGANVTILPGCTRIGVGAVIGAAAVVTGDVPDFAVVVGNPARVIRERLTPHERAALLERRPWEFEPEHAARVLAEIRESAESG